MAREKEINVIVDAKNKAKGTFLEVSKDLQNIGKSAKSSMNTLYTTLDSGTSHVKKFTDKLGFMDKAVGKALKGASASSAVYLAATLRDFSQLEDGISKINTLYDQTAQSQRKMTEESMKLFTMLPTNFTDITDGINEAMSSGLNEKDATMAGRKFGMASVAGITDMQTVTLAAMGTMNAYKLSIQDLDRILDLQFTTVDKGIVEYEQLASSLGTGVLANAQSAGITLEELYGSIAMISKNAIPANIATTSLIQLFNKFTDSKAIKGFKEFGVNIQDANHKTRPMIEILKDMNAQFEKKGMTSEQRKGYLKDLLGSDEAARAIMPLLGDLKEFDSILKDMENSKGATRGAFDDRLDNINTQVKLLWNNAKMWGIEQIYAMKPAMDAIMAPFLKKQKLQFDLAELEDKLDLEKDPVKIKIYEETIAGLKLEISEIDMTPMEAFRDGLKEGVENLEKINPPLAKFVDTIGNFALNFVGEEGAENRGKAKTVGGVVAGVYGIKKFFDVLLWLNENLKMFKGTGKGDKGGSISETLTKTLKTMDVTAGVVNVYGGTGKDIGDGTLLPEKNSNKGGSKEIVQESGKKAVQEGSKKVGQEGSKKTLQEGGQKIVQGIKSNPLAAIAIIGAGTVLYNEYDKNKELENYNKNPESYTYDEKNNLVTKDYFDARLSDLKNTRPEFLEGATISPASANLTKEPVRTNQEIKTSKDIEVSQDSSKYIKEINTSILSFSETMKKLANIQPEQVRPGPLKEKGNNFILKELNRITEIDNKINLQNDVKVAAPAVNVSVNIDGKNIPARVEMKSSGSDMNFLRTMEILARRTGNTR